MLPNQPAPTPQKTPIKSLSQIVEEFKDDIFPGELMDILKAVSTLKRGSGWGRIEIVYLNKELDTIEVSIKLKPKKQKWYNPP
jgi:hypothetical protein